jgi:hypothetical protein
MVHWWVLVHCGHGERVWRLSSLLTVVGRNTAGKASTGGLRPNVLGILRQQWALWRGEEKSPGSKCDPKLELVSKLLWTCPGLPYILF